MYYELLNEFGLTHKDVEIIPNGVVITLIDQMFDKYPFTDGELTVLIKAVGELEKLDNNVK